MSNTEEDVPSSEATAAESLGPVEADELQPADDVENASPEPQPPRYQRFDCASGDASELFKAANAARRALEQGECIVLPTDTVYGIGADAFNPDAVQRLLDAKVRGRDMPPPVLIADPSLVRVLAVDVPASAKALVDRHWPGALTVICRVQPSLRLDLGDAEGTIALRVPDHDLAREILRQTGPMAVSSANTSGRPAAVTCDEAVAQLGESVSVYLDGGRLGTGSTAPSTIVDFTQKESGEVLRHGALSVELLRETCPELEDLVPPPPTEPPIEDFARPESPAEPSDPEPSDPEPSEPEPSDPEPSDPEAVDVELDVKSNGLHGSHAVDLPLETAAVEPKTAAPEPIDHERSAGA